MRVKVNKSWQDHSLSQVNKYALVMRKLLLRTGREDLTDPPIDDVNVY